ncbi:FR47-like protein [Elasticomyces elasticus]|nr:FR47-like protein [Elasticomyces elasticus]
MADASSQIGISYATADDIPQILAMIRELASYEKCEHKVEATEASLKATLTFAPTSSGHTQHTNPGYAKTLILRLPSTPQHPGDESDAVAGMAMFFNNYSTWRSKPGVYLEDLYGKGVWEDVDTGVGAGGAED